MLGSENVVGRSRKDKAVRNKLLQAGRTKEGQADKFLVTPSPVVDDATTLSNIDLAPLSVCSSRESQDLFFPKIPDFQTIADASSASDWSKDANLTDPAAIPTASDKSPPCTPDHSRSDSAHAEETKKELSISTACTDLPVDTTPKDSPNVIEENYLPMTPKKSILDPNYLQTTKNSENEENAYMEMCRGLAFLDAKDLMSSPNEFQKTSHETEAYEIFSFGKDKIEPVYMEVSHSPSAASLTKSSKNDQDNASDVPEVIIKPQKNPKLNGQDTKSDSESADADDEASKDLDSLDAPFHPRFSLSDTFRPASYYLGASQVFTEFHDSSDSELVSPPPIPTSPPLTDELENSYAARNTSTNDYFNLSGGLQDYKDQENSDLDLSNSDRTQDTKKVGYLSADNLKQQDSNNTLFNFDSNRHLRSRSYGNDELNVELRKSSYYKCLLKRRPVSEEFCDELESLDSSFNKTLDSIEGNDFLKDLKRDISDTSKTSPLTIENIDTSTDKETLLNNSGSLHDYGNMCMNAEARPFTEYKLYPDHGVDSTLNKYSDTLNYNPVMPSDYVQRLYSDTNLDMTSSDIIGLLPASSARSTPSLRTNSSVSIQELEKCTYSDTVNLKYTPAPYYCSDLLLDDRTSPTDRALLMNNQRTVLSMKEIKKDITRIVNPIGHTNSPSSDQKTNNTYKLAAEARSVSMDFLNLADKTGQIDKKNIYESDTLKRNKTVENANSQVCETVNICSPCPVDKTAEESDDKDIVLGSPSENKLSISLREEMQTGQEAVPQKPTFQRKSSSEVHDAGTPSEETVPDIWEEDILWSNRLRVVSQRHTRSLDDLDDIGVAKSSSKKHFRKKLTRDVTYVNDNVANFINIRGKQKDKEVADEQISENGHVQKTQSNLLVDRETLRQWDLLSSAPSDAASTGIRPSSVAIGGNEQDSVSKTCPLAEQNEISSSRRTPSKEHTENACEQTFLLDGQNQGIGRQHFSCDEQNQKLGSQTCPSSEQNAEVDPNILLLNSERHIINNQQIIQEQDSNTSSETDRKVASPKLIQKHGNEVFSLNEPDYRQSDQLSPSNDNLRLCNQRFITYEQIHKYGTEKFTSRDQDNRFPNQRFISYEQSLQYSDKKFVPSEQTHRLSSERSFVHDKEWKLPDQAFLLRGQDQLNNSQQFNPHEQEQIFINRQKSNSEQSNESCSRTFNINDQERRSSCQIYSSDEQDQRVNSQKCVDVSAVVEIEPTQGKVGKRLSLIPMQHADYQPSGTCFALYCLYKICLLLK